MSVPIRSLPDTTPQTIPHWIDGQRSADDRCRGTAVLAVVAMDVHGTFQLADGLGQFERAIVRNAVVPMRQVNV